MVGFNIYSTNTKYQQEAIGALNGIISKKLINQIGVGFNLEIDKHSEFFWEICYRNKPLTINKR